MKSHKKMNVPGSTRKRTPGDKLKIAVLGSKGFEKDQRERGAHEVKLDTDDDPAELDKLELTFLQYLHFQRTYKHPGMTISDVYWGVFYDEGYTDQTNAVIIITDTIKSINEKKGTWIHSEPSSSVWLNDSHYEDIDRYIPKRRGELSAI